MTLSESKHKKCGRDLPSQIKLSIMFQKSHIPTFCVALGWYSNIHLF